MPVQRAGQEIQRQPHVDGVRQFTAVDSAFDDDGGSAKFNSPTPSISGSAKVVL
jgi:hypothetical protein